MSEFKSWQVKEFERIAKGIRDGLVKLSPEDEAFGGSPITIGLMPGAARSLLLALEIAQKVAPKMEEAAVLVKAALMEGIAIATHRDDLTVPWDNGERAWRGSEAFKIVEWWAPLTAGTKPAPGGSW